MRKLSPFLLLLFLFLMGFGAFSQQKSDKTQLKEKADKIMLRGDGSISFINIKKGKKVKSFQFIKEHRNALGLDKDSELKEFDVKEGPLGMTTRKLKQYHKGIEIEGAVVLLHEEGGILKSINGHIVDDFDLNVNPSISEKVALRIAIDNINADSYRWEQPGQETFQPKGELRISSEKYSLKKEEMHLVYSFEIYAVEPLGKYHIEIDAMTGVVVNKYNMIHNVETTGTGQTHYNGTVNLAIDEVNSSLFKLRSNTKNITTSSLQNGTFAFGNEVDITSTSNSFSDTSHLTGASAHWATEASYDYFQSKFGISGYNSGTEIRAIVNYGTNQANAFWDGYGFFYGDGGFNTTAHVSLDIVGHEYTHAITYFSSGLIYQDESGALNESFSDIFGHNIEVYKNPTGWSWRLADEVFTDGGSYREMANPNARNQPDTYKGDYWYTGTEDNGGVHTNSGVQNFWYYLLTEGGTGVNDKGYSYNVSGIGLDKAEQIAYRNLTTYLTSSSTHPDARLGAEQAAADLFGNGSTEFEAVVEAWQAVGVPGQTPSAYAEAALDFSEVYVSFSDTLDLKIMNLGLGNLQVTDITSDHAAFRAKETSFTIVSDSSYVVKLAYSPTLVQSDMGTLTITTDHNIINVQLSGSGIDFPVIATVPASLTQTIASGSTYSQPITVENNGLGDLSWSASASGPLSLDNTSGTITSGNSTSINVDVNATGLFAGVYNYEVTINSNDPVQDTLTIPYELNVIGDPVLAIQDTLKIDSIFSNISFTRRIEIENAGFDSLKVNGISFSSMNVSIEGDDSFIILPQDKKELTIRFGQLVVGDFSEAMSIMSNTDSTGMRIVGYVKQTPISIDKDTLDFTILSGKSDSTLIVLGNLESHDISLDLIASDTFAVSTMGISSANAVTKAVMIRNFDINNLSFYWDTFNNFFSDVELDVVSLNKSNITYEDIVNSGADVLVMGDSFFTPLTDNELNAIIRYANEGHGIVGYGNIFFPLLGAPHNAVAPLWGLSKNVVYNRSASFDGTSVKIRDHEIFEGIPETSVAFHAAHASKPWSETNLEGEVLSESMDKTEVVVRNFNRVYFSSERPKLEDDNSRLFLRNAIKYADKNFGSVDIDINTPTISANTSENVQVKMHTRGLREGNYQYHLNIYESTTDQIIKKIPVNVNVIGVPLLVATDSLSFQDTNVDFESTEVITIENTGGSDLVIDSLLLDSNVFKVEATFPMVVSAFSSASVNVTFDPEVAGDYVESVIIQSNDVTQQGRTIKLSGKALDIPKMNIVQEDISLTLMAGDSITQSVTVQNHGGLELNWSASSSYGDVMEEVDLTNLGTNNSWSGTLYLNDKVYVCNYETGRFYTYDPVSQSLNFEFEIPDDRAGRLSTDGSRIYTQVNGYGIYVYNLSGQLVDYFQWGSGEDVLIPITYHNNEVWRSEKRESAFSNNLSKTDLDGNLLGQYTLDVPARIKGIDWLNDETLIVLQSEGTYSNYSLNQYAFDGSTFTNIDSVMNVIDITGQDISYQYPNLWSTDYYGKLVRIDYSGNALVKTKSGTIGAQSETILDYKVKTDGLGPGEYQYHLEITSDDPRISSPVRIPIYLEVISAPSSNTSPILNLSNVSVLEDESLTIDLNTHVSDLQSAYNDLQISYQILSAQSEVISNISVNDLNILLDGANMSFSGAQDISGIFEVKIVAEDPQGLISMDTMLVTVVEVQDLTPTITFHDMVKNFGAPDFELKATSNSTGSFTYSLVSDTTGTVIEGDTVRLGNSGSVIVRATQSPDAVYNGGYADAILTIATVPIITVQVVDTARTYGDSNPIFRLIYSGFENGEDVTALDVLPIANVSTMPDSPTGSYSITLSGGSDDKYVFELQHGELIIVPAPLTITADNRTLTYGDDVNMGNSATYAGFKNGENESVLTGNLSFAYITETTVGTYATVVVPEGLSSINYSITYEGADLTINPRPIEITADAVSKIYGDTDPTLTFRISGGSLINSDSLTGAMTRVAGEDVGTYPIQQGTLSASGNYTVSFTLDNLTITPRPVEITADTAGKVYGEIDPILTYQITSGSLINSDSLTGSIARVAGEDVGTYTIQQGTLSAPNNYSVSFIPNNLTISLRPIEITAHAVSKVYGDTDPILTYQITSGSLINSDSLTGSIARVAGEDVGTYTIQQGTLSASSNYSVSFTPNNLTINPKPIEITAHAVSKVYGDTDPTLIYSLSDGILHFEDELTGLLNREAGEDAGSYKIGQGTVTAGTNYTEMFISSDLIINKADLVISAQNTTSTYGNDPELNTTLIYAGFVNGQGQTVLDELPAINTTASATSEVGIYDVTLSGGKDNNYAYILQDGQLEVTPRMLTVTADDKSIVYGGANLPTFTATYLGFVNGETEAVLTRAISITTPATAKSNAGNYPITVTGGDADNYIFSYVNGALTIAQAHLIITADDQMMDEGGAVPELTFTGSGFVNGEDLSEINVLPTSSTPANSSSLPGAYVITLAGGSDNNYALTLVDGTLTISDVLGIENLEEIKVYPNPTMDYMYTSSSEVGSMVVYDLSGRVVATSQGQSEIDLTWLNKGTYLLEVKKNTGRLIYTGTIIRN